MFLFLKLNQRPYKHLFIQSKNIYGRTGSWEEINYKNRDILKEIEAYWKGKLISNGDQNKYLRRCVNEIPNLFNNEKTKYILAMFPYPSGALHMGHVRVYTLSDTIARYFTMQGFKVIHPMGWDAFGLPAENAAIEQHRLPDEWTLSNIAQMKRQLLDLGCGFNWECEFATCDPLYYKWTQYLFIMLYKEGLAYQDEAFVNWDPIDQTVLADEQVDENGLSWRSGAKVEKKLLNQWFIKTTRYAEPLVNGLNDSILNDWDDIIKVQRNWIGECTGFNLEVEVIAPYFKNLSKKLIVWTKFLECLHGVAFIGVKSSHKYNKKEFIYKVFGDTKLLNITVVNPLSLESIPLIVCDNLNFEDGSNYYFGIPSLNELDTKVCNQLNLKFKYILSDDRSVLKNSGELNGLSRDTALNIVLQKLREAKVDVYPCGPKLCDWLISRQRFWGTPIPIIHCLKCGPVAVPENDLPVLLPKMTHFCDKNSSYLKSQTEWYITICPKCGDPGHRETDTMDTFMDSSWYFLRFLDSSNAREIFDPLTINKFMPVDLYVGGKEHALLHLYYARFMQHFLADKGLVGSKEPFVRLLVQGKVMSETYKVKKSGRYLKKEEIDFSGKYAAERSSDEEVVVTYEKMSKSKHNGIDPEEVLKQYGTDTTRLLIMAGVSPKLNRNWPPPNDILSGALNWQHRLWKLIKIFINVRKHPESVKVLTSDEMQKQEKYLFNSRNYAVKGVTYHLGILHQPSNAISKLYGLTNSLLRVPQAMALTKDYELALASQIIMLCPIMPLLCHELWDGFKSVSSFFTNTHTSVHLQQWPEVDLEYELELSCQVDMEEFRVSLPRSVLDTLTEEKAIEIFQNEKLFSNYTEKKSFKEVKFVLLPGCLASLHIKTSNKDKVLKI